MSFICIINRPTHIVFAGESRLHCHHKTFWDGAPKVSTWIAGTLFAWAGYNGNGAEMKDLINAVAGTSGLIERTRINADEANTILMGALKLLSHLHGSTPLENFRLMWNNPKAEYGSIASLALAGIADDGKRWVVLQTLWYGHGTFAIRPDHIPPVCGFGMTDPFVEFARITTPRARAERSAWAALPLTGLARDCWEARRYVELTCENERTCGGEINVLWI